MRIRKCQEAYHAAWDTYYRLINDTKMAFTKKDVDWSKAFTAMNENGQCIIRGIDSRVFRDLKPRPEAWKENKKAIFKSR